jgi:hypothetical protein
VTSDVTTAWYKENDPVERFERFEQLEQLEGSAAHEPFERLERRAVLNFEL